MCAVSMAAILFQFTPLREGRRALRFFNLGIDDFNSRPSARGDGTRTCRFARSKFQFTPLREGRPCEFSVHIIKHAYFNSRPSARGD